MREEWVDGGGTALMSADQVRAEKAMQDAYAQLAHLRRSEQSKTLWHGFSYLMPFAAAILGACVLGICIFVTLQVTSSAWQQTHWSW